MLSLLKRQNSSGAIATALVVGLVSASVGVLSGSAAQASTPTAEWGAPSTLSADGQDAQVAFSADGTRAVAAWWTNGTDQVEVSAATVSGNAATWGTPVVVSTSGSEATSADIALSADGTKFVVTWQEQVDGTSPWIPMSTSGTVSGTTPTVGATQTLASATNVDDPGRTQAHISADGTAATYLWRSEDVVSTASATVNGTTQSIGTVSDFASVGTSLDDPNISLALSRDGSRAVALWVDGANDPLAMVVASGSITGNTATWSTGTDLNTQPAGDTYPDIEISDDGTLITAAWKQLGSDQQVMVPVTKSATWNGSVSWGDLTQLTPDSVEIDVVTLGLSASGLRALIVYEDQTTISGDGTVASRSASISGSTQTWGSEEAPPGTGDIDEMDTQLSADGRVAVVVWEGNLTNTQSINSAPVSVDGPEHTWGAITELTPTGVGGVYPEIAISRGGCKATTFWSARTSSTPGPAVARSATLTCIQPTATAVSPSSGPTAGGTEITITGSGFYPGATVTLGGKACTNVQVVSPTKIACTTPSSPKGAVDVVVSNDDGQSATLSKAFTYIPTTKLNVTAISKNKEIPVRKRTAVVKKATSNGKKTIKVVCKVKGKKVTGALGRQVCGTSVNATTGRVSLAPRCQVSATVVITAKKKGAYATDWRRTWTTRSNRGDIAWLPKACLS
ncbi:MAG: IPT/TIG domain-containing protein [Candidatus Nanopelagicales bacterium]